MRNITWMGVASVVMTALALARCVGDSSSNPVDASTDHTSGGGDAGSDAPQTQGFTVSLQPSHVTFDTGDPPVAVKIALTRASGFTDDVAFSISAPSGITATTATDTGTGGSSSSFTVSLDADAGSAVVGDLTPLTVTASNPSKSFVVNSQLGIRVGSVLDIADGGVAIPSYASAVLIKVWGAGGGGSCAACGGGYVPTVSGGGGGFASAVVPVSPGTTLAAIAGVGGVPGHGGSSADGGCGADLGGSGGGFTAVQDQNKTYLVIAGGGGGASFGYAGGAGGGAAGQNAPSLCGGYGGTQTQGGASTDGGCSYMGTAGSAYQGGNGENQSTCGLPVTDGGAPGGGNGGAGVNNIGTGGGGGGYFGGGGGGEGLFMVNGSNTLFVGAGAGGSGWFAGDAGTLVTGDLSAAASTTDPDFALCPAGAAVGGTPGTNNGVGGPGCIVVRLAKP